MTKDVVPGGSGLLSKVVKFVKSPTTHWADLDRPAADDSGSESRLLLKEMIERKRRNDFVRNREFDMLRKVRRRETLRSGEPAVGGPSLFSSSELTQGGERAHTLKKIDEIEAQMSNTWLKRRGGTAVASDAEAPSELDETQLIPPGPMTTEMPLASAPVLAEPALAPQAFAPTLTMDQVVLPPATLAGAAPYAEQPHAPDEVVGNSLEVTTTVQQNHELEEAAIRFANGDAAGAEASLLALVSEGGNCSDDMDTWLTLFDLYRCVGDVTKFDDAASDFAARFGRSAPQWARIGESVSGTPAAAAASAAARTGQFDWACPSTLGAAAVAALSAALDRHGSPWRIDWRHLKVVEHAALLPLGAVLKRWADAPGRFDFLAVERLIERLAENSRTDDSDSDPLWWETRLALLRVLDQMDEFELVALNYCVTYEVSPPAWEAPKNRWRSLVDDVHAPQDSGLAALGPSGAASAHAFAVASALDGATPGVFAAALSGTYVGSADAVVQALAAQTEAQAFELNCCHLTRVDFGAAGDLLNWSMDQQAKGYSVTFQQVNRLVAAFFGVIGINDAARVTLRTD